jgi:hypothetical protein
MPQINSNPFSIVIQPPRDSASVPAWVPPAGYFADVPMINTPQDVAPAVLAGGSGGMDAPFTFWGGSAILRDFSPLGAQVYYSGGHETSPLSINLQQTLICDFSTLRWSVANLPLVGNTARSFGNDGLAPDGTPYCPHSYLGLQEIPTGWGGGKQGSLASFFWAGGVYPNKINVMDVSKPTMGYSQMATVQRENDDPTKIRFFQTAQGGNYPITVMDEARQGWWAAVNAEAQYTLFVSKTGKISQFPALGGNLQSGSMVLCPSLDLLIVIDGGYRSGGSNAYRSLYIRNLKTGAMTRSLTAGPVPSLYDGYDGSTATFHRPDRMGLQWVEELGFIVGIDESVTPPALVKLTPPATNPDTLPWTWSTVAPLNHWPQDVGGQPTLQSSLNGVWSKLRWVPSLQALVYGTARNRRPQVIRPS